MATNPKISFAKPALTAPALLAKLKQQGLVVANDVYALQYINFVGHYRLKGYWYQLQDPVTKAFKQGTTFDNIVDRYECDREIRSIILEGIERLEVAIRNAICNHLSLADTPHWYLNPSLFTPTKNFGLGSMLVKIENEVGRSRDKTSIQKYYENHDEPYLPPSWAMSECVTLGMWSRTFAILKETKHKKSIAAKFLVTNEGVFESWLHTLAVLRNMAAHHDRFLDNKLGVSPQNYKARNIKFNDNKSVYAALTMMHVLLDAIKFNGTFKSNVANLKNKYGMGMMQILGFPNNWPVAAVGW